MNGNPHILITGATGYIGRRIVAALVKQVPDCRILTLNRDKAKAEMLMPYEQCTHASGIDAAQIAAFAPKVVLHLATLSTSRADTDIIRPMLEANIAYGVELLDALSKSGQAEQMLFVNTGSFAEYRLGVEAGQRDAYLYTATKSAFRHFVDYYADAIGLHYLTLVPYTVYGGKDTAKKLMDYMVESASATEPVGMTAGEQVLDFVHVDDVVEAFVAVVKHADEIMSRTNEHNLGEIHVGTGIGTRIRDLATLIEQTLHLHLNIAWGARPYRPLDVMHAIAPKQEWFAAYWQPRVDLRQGIIRQFETR